ncbi:MAG: TlpA family protein disulfide reductase [Deltaproteobacteria bacterium]|nr:TlpA family protein disulfide reductase [Deltaproteobacteria bacterium]
MSRSFVVRLGLGLAIVSLAGVLSLPAAAAPTRARPGQMPAVGATPPEIDGQSVSGTDPLSLSRLQGRVVILDFWATWCGPCRAVMPFLDRMHVRHHAQGLSVVGLTAEPVPRVRQHLERAAVRYTIGAAAQQTMQRYAVRGLPTMVVIGRGGKVRMVTHGAAPHDLRHIERLIPRLLSEAP